MEYPTQETCSLRAASDLNFLSCQKTFSEFSGVCMQLEKFYPAASLKNACKDLNRIVVDGTRRRIDTVAEKMVPDNYKQENIKPILTKGDGNCLFNAASIALCGTEKLSAELRIRTVIELADNLQFYKNHPSLEAAAREMKTKRGQSWSISSIYEAIIFSNEACEICSTKEFQAALEHEVMRTSRNGNFSSLLQIMALASAIDSQIHMIYPDPRNRMLSLLNGIYHPRKSATGSKGSIIIMWTSVHGWPDRTKLLSVDHFVPLLPIESSSTDGVPSEWTVVGSRRRQKRVHKQKPEMKETAVPNWIGSVPDGSLESLGQHSSPVELQKKINDSEKPIKKAKRYGKSSYCELDKNIQKSRYEFNLSMPQLSEDLYAKLGQKSDSTKNTTNYRTDKTNRPVTMPLLSKDGSEQQKRKNDYQKPSIKKTKTDGKSPSSEFVKNHQKGYEFRLLFPQLSEDWYAKQGQSTKNTTNRTDKTNVPVTISQVPEKINHNVPTPKFNNDTEEIKDGDKSLFIPRLTLATEKWYQRRGRLAGKNESRSTKANNMQRVYQSGVLVAIGESSSGKQLKENIEHLKIVMNNTKDRNKRASLHAISKVGQALFDSGPILSTQEAGKIYKKEKQSYLGLSHEDTTENKTKSSYLFSIFSRHLNIVQCYIHGKAYIIENHQGVSEKISNLIEQLNNIVPETNKVVNDHLYSRLSELLNVSLKMMDTKRDSDIVKGLFAKATSVQFTAKLQGIQNRNAIMNCRDELCTNLNKYGEIEKTSMIVNNSMTNEQQYLLTKRIISKRKQNEMKLKNDCRGRMLKAEEWPDLAKTLEYIFNGQDITDRAGGGLEAHSRLKNDVLFRTKDNNTFMRQAHEIVNAVSPPSFSISLSSCYNYTMTYKKNAAAARRHHDGMDVNAKISLHRAPHTKVDKLVVNVHYATALVNYVCDYANSNEHNTFVDSKDAKRIVCGDIAPVPKPNKVWSDAIEYPDHDWKQNRTNAVTPMTHLFLRTEITKRTSSIISNPTINDINLHSPTSNTVLHVTRTGKAITLVNPSFFERETTFRLFHEILLLLSKPALDDFFRNQKTGKLKTEFFFIVDNGPAEDPSSALVQMLLVRLQKLLNLDRVVQLSFSEYHSKRNFVERVHATENKMLERNGPFSSREVHNEMNIVPGSKKHRENMERMAENVVRCLKQGRYNGTPLEVYRGVKNDLFLFDDEEKLKSFLARTEEAKGSCNWTYYIKQSPLLFELEVVWKLDKNFSRRYRDDYHALHNAGRIRTSWIDKYITAVYRSDDKWNGNPLPRQELQPVPDYIRWLQTKGELHYLSYERIQQVTQADKGSNWSQTPGLFRPDRLLDMLFTLNPLPLDDMYSTFSCLTWLPETVVKDYFKHRNELLIHEREQDVQREKWRHHFLYSKTINELSEMCKKAGLQPGGRKHNLVERLVQELEADSEEIVDASFDYNGDLDTLPKSMSDLRKLSVAKLRYVLHSHGVITTGTKEQVLLRLYLVMHGRYYACFTKEENELLKTITIAENIICEQKRQYILEPQSLFRKRTHASRKEDNDPIPLPNDISFQNLQNVFKPLKEYISTLRVLRKKRSEEMKCTEKTNISKNEEEIYEEYFNIGAKVKIRWTKEEIGDSGWQCGWYCAQVQESCLDDDIIKVLYFLEPECVYTVCVTQYLAAGKLKLA